MAVTHLRVRTLRAIEMAEHGVKRSHRGLPSAPYAHIIAFLCVVSHPRVPSGPATGARGALPSAAHTPPWLSHGSAPVAWSVMGHDATVGVDALAVAPVRPAGPARAILRLAIARALLLKPDWLFLDEATSALDEDQEAALYRRLAETLGHTTLISIGHRRSLEAYHTRVITVDREAGHPGVLRAEPSISAG